LKHDTVIVLDFGAQYSQLIARRVRECGVYCEILPFSATLEQIKAKDPKGIILSGGPSSVYAKGAPHVTKDIFEAGIPILGICYGIQMISFALGGKVEKAHKREFGLAKLNIRDSKNLFAQLPKSLNVWMSHGDHVVRLPKGYQVLASTSNCHLAAAANLSKKIYGIQFHPEVVHTEKGKRILENFVKMVCGCKATWNMDAYEKTAVAAIGWGRFHRDRGVIAPVPGQAINLCFRQQRGLEAS
jgi:GMP synthase (glutamine-hydrolysing)